MGTMIGVAVGYLIGSRMGTARAAELRDAWTTIKTSEEVRDQFGGGLRLVGGLVQRGMEMLAERVELPEDTPLRRVA
jgi:hypothetical protein